MTTRVLVDGTIIVGPADSGLLAFFAREGVLAVGARRALPPRTGPLLGEVERAAAYARTAAGTGVGPSPGEPVRWVTTVEAAEVLGVTTTYVRRLCRSGTLAAERRGPMWTIDADALAALALSRRSES